MIGDLCCETNQKEQELERKNLLGMFIWYENEMNKMFIFIGSVFLLSQKIQKFSESFESERRAVLWRTHIMTEP